MIKMKAFSDNVMIQLEPLERETSSGLFLVHGKPTPTSIRSALVLSVGPGRNHPNTGALLPMSVKVGDRVIVDARAGQIAQNYDFDLYKPRQNSGADISEDVRIVREDEIHAVVDGNVSVG